MIRLSLALALLAPAAMPAAAQPLVGDFECLSDLGGPDTYHGTLRIEEPTRFGFLSKDFAVEAWHPLDISDPAAVFFDDAFAAWISTGATVVRAEELVGQFTYRVVIRTGKGDEVPVFCEYVY